MKIREGFVSNSSSASFLCEICRTCWDSDHAPLIVGGLCDACSQKVGICNCCGHIFAMAELFDTKLVTLKRGGRPDKWVNDSEDVDGESSYCDWDTRKTCAKCLIIDEEMIAVWAAGTECNRWTKRMSNPKHIVTALDKLLVEALLRHEETKRSI